MSEKRKVIIVDDDLYFLQSTKERLADEGFEAITANTLSGAKKQISNHSDAAAIVLDIMMPPDGESEFETQMGYKSGLVLARWVTEHYPNMAVIGLSGVKSLDVGDWFEEHGVPFFEKGSGEFIEGLNRILFKEDRLQHVRTFIVHGRDDAAKYDLKNYLQNTLNLPEPLVLHEQPSLGRTIIEKFEDIAQQVNLVFVLLTPDDHAQGSEKSNEAKRRARQNVIFEMGFFFGKLQRKKGRILLLYKEPLELPSDISGIIYVDISNGIESAGEHIRKELSFLYE
jgi:CheY-like chemotaxis protein